MRVYLQGVMVVVDRGVGFPVIKIPASDSRVLSYSNSDKIGVFDEITEANYLANYFDITDEGGGSYGGTYEEVLQSLSDFIGEPTKQYKEKWQDLSASLSNVWETIVIPDVDSRRVLGVTVRMITNANNVDVGVRSVGSIENRTSRIDTDSAIYFTVKCNQDKEIEVFTSNSSATRFTIESELI